ncbi:MAG: biotin transporter BioY [Devosiaceae bacterium]|nr:biotin transporter BioY [Devosiaceae bacterium]
MATDIVKLRTPMMEALLPKGGIARYASYVGLAVIGSILLWVSAKTHVPFFPVPMTLQTLAILLIAATCGFRLGLAIMGLYMIEGMLGLPIFSGTPDRGIGIAYMMGPTAGYLVGFVVATGLVGWFAERGAAQSALKLFAVMFAGAALILALGFAWLATFIGAEAAFNVGVAPFMLGELFKVSIAALLVPAAGKLLKR